MPVLVEGIVSSANECDPMVRGDQLYFSSDAANGAGSYDLYMATRRGETYDSPVRLTELASPQRDRDVWVAPDQRWLILASARNRAEVPARADELADPSGRDERSGEVAFVAREQVGRAANGEPFELRRGVRANL